MSGVWRNLTVHRTAKPMSAEPIAKVIQDIRNKRVRPLPDAGNNSASQLMINADTLSMIIDATAVYQDISSEDHEPIAIYEDHVIVPPAKNFAVCYENEHGNVHAMLGGSYDLLRDDPDTIPPWLLEAVRTGEDPSGWRDPQDNEVPEWMDGDHPIEWHRVRWAVFVMCVNGGRSQGKPVPTHGPVCAWIVLADGDGTLLDVNWAMLTKLIDIEQFQNPGLVLLGALNLLSCTNVQAEEPVRSRAERRRLARTGVTVKVLTVKPTGKRSKGVRGEPVGVRLTSVRGHFAHYGACCPSHEPRGLLFGRLTGRYYVPQHARGSADIGEIHKTYQLETS